MITGAGHFLKRHPYYFVYSISAHFSLGVEFLRANHKILLLADLGRNENLYWSRELAEQFLIYFQPKGIDSFWFSLNEKLPWSIDLIKRNEKYLNWEGLAQNNVILNDPKILAAFEDQLNPYLSINRSTRLEMLLSCSR